MKPIDIKPKDLETVKKILAAHVPEYEVRAFGSRVQWTAKDSSDFDLVIMTEKPLPSAKMADLKEAFTESDLPFKVDVVDWAATKDKFRKIIEKQFVRIKTVKPALSEIRLGDVCEKIGSGATPRGGSSAYLDTGGVSLIRSQNVYNDGFHKDGLAHITSEHADQLNNVEVKEGDVLLNITGGSVGRCCHVASDILPARVNQHVAIIRSDEKKLHNRFLRYYMVSPMIQGYLLSMAAAGATRPALTKEMIEDLNLLAPDLTTQRAIAHILGTLDDKIELNRRMNKTLEEIARTIYKSWFVDFDPVRKKAAGEPTGLPEEIEKLFPKEFEKSELGEIPKGWEFPLLSELMETTSITHSFNKPQLIFLNTSDIFNGFVTKNTYGDVASFPGQAKKSIRRDDILYSEIRPANRRFAYIDFDAYDYVVSTKLMVLRAIGSVSPIALYFFMTSDEVVSELQMLAESRSGTFPRITFNQVKRLRMVVPSKAILDEYTSFLSNIFTQSRFLHRQNETLSEFRDTLLPRLLSGSLPIRDAEKLLKEANV